MRRAIIGLGNPLKSDDNVGNIIALRLGGVAGATAPENHMPRDAEEIILIDAVLFDAPVGAVREFSPREMQEFLHSTHNLPISIFRELNPRAKIRVIGIRPESLEFGESLSSELKASLEQVESEVKRLLPL